jgi:hypothetical protein
MRGPLWREFLMRRSKLKTLGMGALVVALSTAAGIAYAASERYDDAKSNIDKAVALLKAIERPEESAAEKGHRTHAIKQLEGALVQIARAKEAADKAPKPTPSAQPAPTVLKPPAD